MSDNYRNQDQKTGEEVRQFDNLVHALTVIQEPHRLSHDGFMHHDSGKLTGIVNGGNQDILLNVPALTFPHIQRISVSVEAGDVDTKLYEGTTTSADGAASPSLNTNRNSSNTPNMVVTISPTVTSVGTLIHTDWLPPEGTGKGKKGGIIGETLGEEWLLAPGNKYLFRVTNNSGGTIAMRYEIVWYEIGYEDNA